jgi:hypothetical protein
MPTVGKQQVKLLIEVKVYGAQRVADRYKTCHSLFQLRIEFRHGLCWNQVCIGHFDKKTRNVVGMKQFITGKAQNKGIS